MHPREFKKPHFFSVSSNSTFSQSPMRTMESEDKKMTQKSKGKSQNKANSIVFSPKVFQLSNKIYKDQKIDMKSEVFLPKVNLSLKLLRKIQTNLHQNKAKTAYLYGNQFKFVKTAANRLEPVYKLNEISYAIDESFEEKFQQMQAFPITLFCLPIGECFPFFISKAMVSQQIDPFKKGLESFQNLDCSQAIKKLSDLSLSEAHPIYDCELILDQNPLDLVFLNNFRIFLYCQVEAESPEETETFSLRKLLVFPDLDFTIQMISQPFKLVSTPLTHILTKKTSRSSTANSFITASNSSSGRNKKSSIKFGFLTLDQNHRICPLMASDPISLQVPLIGVWIFGISPPRGNYSENECRADENYLIWGVLAEFVRNQQLLEKYSFDEKKKSFFLACFSSEESPRFYEVEVNKNNGFRFADSAGYQEFSNDYEDISMDSESISDKFEDLIGKEQAKSLQTSGKKLKIEEINELPREIPKMETLSNYLSPRTASNSTFGMISAENSGLPCNPLTERLLQEQAKQLRFLQEQVISLQEALKKQGNKEDTAKIEENNKEIMNFYKKSERFNKQVVNQSTNTTFRVENDRKNIDFSLASQGNNDKIEMKSTATDTSPTKDFFRENEPIINNNCFQKNKIFNGKRDDFFEKNSNFNENEVSISIRNNGDFDENGKNQGKNSLSEGNLDIFKQNCSQNQAFIEISNPQIEKNQPLAGNSNNFMKKRLETAGNLPESKAFYQEKSEKSVKKPENRTIFEDYADFSPKNASFISQNLETIANYQENHSFIPKTERNPAKNIDFFENSQNFNKENQSFHSNIPKKQQEGKKKEKNNSIYLMQNDFLDSVKKKAPTKRQENTENQHEDLKSSLTFPRITFEKARRGDSESSEDEEIKKIQKKYINKIKI